MISIFLLTALVSGHANENRTEVSADFTVVHTEDSKPENFAAIDAAFLGIVQKFEALWGRNVTSSISFGEGLPPNALASCTLYTNGDGTHWGQITVARSLYRPGIVQNEIMIFHELGHCELLRPHDTRMGQTQSGQIIPYSIMYPVILYEDIYTAYNYHYIKELFGR